LAAKTTFSEVNRYPFVSGFESFSDDFLALKSLSSSIYDRHCYKSDLIDEIFDKFVFGIPLTLLATGYNKYIMPGVMIVCFIVWLSCRELNFSCCRMYRFCT